MTLKATVIGGSLGGLITGLMLDRVGIDVEIHERNAVSLESRGAGLRIQPIMSRLFRQVLDIDLGQVTTRASGVQYIDREGRPLHAVEEAVDYTSWGALYGLLRSKLPDSRYHLNRELTGFDEDLGGITAHFCTGASTRSDLLVFADGVNSTGRSLLAQGGNATYGGYICWRGYVLEDAVSETTRSVLGNTMTIALLNPGHIHVYPIPGNVADSGDGRRCFNYVWYRNLPRGPEFEHTMTDRFGVFRQSSVPPGAVRPDVLDELRATARAMLPAPIAELIERTPEPFIQAIGDIDAGMMARGRACLIGDAASGGRPHLGAATTKATINAVTLGRAIGASGGDVPRALRQWEPVQLRLGQAMLERNRRLGEQLQFHDDSHPGEARLRPGIDDLVAEALAAAGDPW